MPSNRTTPPFPPALALIFGVLAVSTAALFIRFAQAEAPSLVIAAYRLGLAALALGFWTLPRRWGELRRVGRRDWLLALLAGFFLALHFASWITSLEYTSVASSVVLVTTTPLWVALLSPWALKEPITPQKLLWMGLALLGGVAVGLSDACSVGLAGLACPSLGNLLQGSAFLGDMLALLGAVMAALYLMIGRKLRGALSLDSYIFVVYGMAAACLLVFVLLARQPLIGYSPQTYLWFALLALVPQLLGHSIFNWALRYLSAAYVSVTLLGEPIGSAVLAFFFLKEPPTALMAFGAILILIGIIGSSRSEAPRLPESLERG